MCPTARCSFLAVIFWLRSHFLELGRSRKSTMRASFMWVFLLQGGAPGAGGALLRPKAGIIVEYMREVANGLNGMSLQRQEVKVKMKETCWGNASCNLRLAKSDD